MQQVPGRPHLEVHLVKGLQLYAACSVPARSLLYKFLAAVYGTSSGSTLMQSAPASPTSTLSTTAQDVERASNAARNFPTAFSPFDLQSLQVNVGTAGSTTAESVRPRSCAMTHHL